VIYRVLKDKYLKVPSSDTEWTEVADKYYSDWQYPNCVGALDGKHVRIQPPPNSGSEYFNYKGYFSFILMALVNNAYEFLYVDVGSNGRLNDASVWEQCSLKIALDENITTFPLPRRLPNSNTKAPFVIVGDEGFGLQPYLMRPYAQATLTPPRRIYNYR